MQQSETINLIIKVENRSEVVNEIARVAIKIFAQEKKKSDDEWKFLVDVLEPHFAI